MYHPEEAPEPGPLIRAAGRSVHAVPLAAPSPLWAAAP